MKRFTIIFCVSENTDGQEDYLIQNFIRNHSPLEYVDFHSDATTHKQLDDARSDTNTFLLELHLELIKYGKAYNKNPIQGWKNLGALAQKIGKEDPKKLA